MGKHFGEFEILDYSEARASTRFYMGAITAVSLPGFLTQFGALRTALDNVILGTVSREQWVGDQSALSNIPPSNTNAQIELRWWVFFEDECNGYPAHITVPTPNADLLIPGTDEADYSNTYIAAFITAFEAIAVHPVFPDCGVFVTNIYLRGRKFG